MFAYIHPFAAYLSSPSEFNSEKEPFASLLVSHSEIGVAGSFIKTPYKESVISIVSYLPLCNDEKVILLVTSLVFCGYINVKNIRCFSDPADRSAQRISAMNQVSSLSRSTLSKLRLFP